MKATKTVRMSTLAMKLAHKLLKAIAMEQRTEKTWSECLTLAWFKVKNKPVLNFDDIYKQYYKQVLFFINGNIKLMDISEDICSEVFMKVYNNLDYYTPEMGKVNTWIYGIAKNSVIDYFRANKKYSTTTNIENFVSDEGECFFTVSESKIASDMVENKEVSDKIMVAINKLTDKYKQIAQLHFVEERTYEEISEMLDISMSNTKVLIHRTKEKLQAELKHEYSLL
jgi:RNA polymerase sigma factor (sigma-70 family)